jgi:hypothetical protein
MEALQSPVFPDQWSQQRVPYLLDKEHWIGFSSWTWAQTIGTPALPIAPCGYSVDIGRGPPFITRIFPFANKPGVGVQVLFYPVAVTNPCLPIDNPHVIRAWDVKANLPQTAIGTDQNLRVRYTGPLPGPGFLPFSGTPDQWNGNIDYDTWIAGGYTNNCLAGIPPVSVTSVQCLDGSLDISPTTGVVICALDTTHHNLWTANQQIALPGGAVCLTLDSFTAPSPTDVMLLCRGNGSNHVFSVSVSGYVVAQDGLIIETAGSTQPYAIQTGATGTVQFAVDTTGKVLTNQGEAGATLGSQLGVIPIYDATGTLLGGLPYYDIIPPPIIYIDDTCADPNGTPIGSHVISPVNTVGAVWADGLGGVFGVQTCQIFLNTIMPVATFPVIAGCVVDATHSDGTILATLNIFSLAGTNICGIMFRFTDGNNFWMWRADQGSGQVELYKIVAGAATLAASAAFSFAITTYPMKVILNGPSIICEIGATVLSTTDSFGLTQTEHGCFFQCVAGAPQWGLNHWEFTS